MPIECLAEQSRRTRLSWTFSRSLCSALLASILAFAALVLAQQGSQAQTASQAERALDVMFTKYMAPAERDRLLDKLANAGADTVQTAGPWDHLEPYSDDSYDWVFMDQFLAAAEARGLKVRMQVMATPDWVHPDLARTEPDQRARVFTPPRGDAELDLYQDFWYDLVSRYGTRVASYEVWNEPNLDSFFRPEADVGEYAAMLRRAYLGAKRANPNVTIVGGALSQNDLGYLDKLYAELRAYPDAPANDDFFDILGVHPYANLGQLPLAPADIRPDAVCSCPFGTRDTTFLGIDRMKALMESHGDGHKKVWIGEFGYHTQQAWTEPITDELRAQYLKQAYPLLDQRPWVLGMSWYAFYRDEDQGWNVYDRATGEETLTFRAFREVTGGSTVPPATESLAFTPTADAYVYGGKPRKNYGYSATLVADAGRGTEKVAYLKFQIPELDGRRVQGAALRIFVEDGGGSYDGAGIRQAGDRWSETALTWRNRPGYTSGMVADQGAVQGGAWLSFDVTSLVTHDGSMTLAIVPTSEDGTYMLSREAPNKPRLVVNLET